MHSRRHSTGSQLTCFIIAQLWDCPFSGRHFASTQCWERNDCRFPPRMMVSVLFWFLFFFFLLSRSHPAIYSRHSQSRYLIRNKNHKLLISRHDMRLAEIWEYKMSCILSISRKSLGGARRQRCVAKANKCFCLPNAKWQIGFGSSSLVN